VNAAAYGIPLAVLTTSAFNTGLILEKRALSRMPAVNLGKVGQVVVSLLSSPAWLAGFALMLTGLACQVVVLTFEPISIVQPILASGVTLTLVLSRLVLRERLGGAEPFCVTVLAVSLILLALSQGSEPAAAARGASTGPLAAVVVPSLVFGLLIAAWRWRSRRMRAIAATGICAGVGIGLLYGVGSLMTKGLSGTVSRDHTAASLVFGVVSSPYLSLLFGCSAAALLLYQAALQACRASILIPVTNVVSSVYFVIAGTWLFHEQLPASPVKLALRLAGIAAAGLVLVALSRQPAASQPEPGLEGGVPSAGPPWPPAEPPAASGPAGPPWAPAKPPFGVRRAWVKPPSGVRRAG
jgi:drug/metabolite transporter (DMT)-like permease